VEVLNGGLGSRVEKKKVDVLYKQYDGYETRLTLPVRLHGSMNENPVSRMSTGFRFMPKMRERRWIKEYFINRFSYRIVRIAKNCMFRGQAGNET